MSDLTVEQIASAVQRGAVTLGSDPVVRPYSVDTIATVYEAIVRNMAGAGSTSRIAERLADDPALADVPVTVTAALIQPCLRHFAAALREVRR